MNSKIIEGKEFRKGAKIGIDKLASVVKSTLGAKGNTVVVRDHFGQYNITKDGVSIAKILEFEDQIQDLGSQMVKDVSLKVNALVGDGTTTAVVIAQALYEEGVKHIELGAKPLAVKQAIEKSLADILRTIESSKIKINTSSKEVKQIALVSSNNDEEIADIITSIYKELGENAVIIEKQGDSIHTTVDKVKGMKFERGYIAPYSVTDKVRNKINFEDSYLFIYDGKLGNLEDLMPAVDIAIANNKPLVIMAEEVGEVVLRALIINYSNGILKSAVIRPPGYGQKRSARLEDIAIMFEGKVITPERKAIDTKDFLCKVGEVEITKDWTSLVGSNGDITERVQHIKAELEEKKGNTYEADILIERLGKLTSGVAIINVGAFSKEEAKERLDRVEDCKYAVKAALEEGIIEGGGIAYLNAYNAYNGSKTSLEGILYEAIKMPFKTILDNADITQEEVLYKLGNRTGYNVLTDEYFDNQFKSGIIDPYKVVRIVLESAVSIVGTLLTTNYAVINRDPSVERINLKGLQ